MLTYADLHNPAITQFGAFLLCESCGTQDTADRIEHFGFADDEIIECSYCRAPVVLARLVIEVLEK